MLGDIRNLFCKDDSCRLENYKTAKTFILIYDTFDSY